MRRRAIRLKSADFPTFGEIIDRSLTPEGRGLLHFIGRDQTLPLNPWIRKRIFPGAYPPTLSEVFERCCYGRQQASRADYEAAQALAERIVQLAPGSSTAERAP